MSALCVLLGSPHKNGVSDQLAEHFLAGFRASGNSAVTLALRDYHINPCQGCNACFRAPYRCILEKRDQTAEIMEKIKKSSMALFVSPIYFYGLPACFKAFIDRGQIFYAQGTLPENEGRPALPPAGAIFCAGRKKGKLLFQGASLTLKWFMRCANSRLEYEMHFKGLENKENIGLDIFNTLWRTGFSMGRQCLRKALYPD